jgi:alkanesulfonate monooxygenase SsuD/methylene tetrahydromethanopterin reductase-like flavin-dependent oxidoreductase (luciferase family)
VRIGVLLPTFTVGAREAFAFAQSASDAELDGVFAYDHLWPMGSPLRPSLAPFALLAGVARRHHRLVVGPLVARVGLVSTSHLVEQFMTLEKVAPGRVVAAIGTGDKLSKAENDAYGLLARDADERRAMLRDAAEALRSSMPVWLGGGGAETNELARSLGVTINLWNVPAQRVAQVGASGPVNWAGPVPDDLVATLNALEAARATWAVLSPQADITALGEWRRAHPLTKLH